MYLIFLNMYVELVKRVLFLNKDSHISSKKFSAKLLFFFEIQITKWNFFS